MAGFVKWEAVWQETSRKVTFLYGGLEDMFPQKTVKVGVIYLNNRRPVAVF